MDTEKFNQAIDIHLHTINDNVVVKAKEYAIEGDRLHNFNRGAEIAGECREKVLFGFALKHLVSVLDIIDKINEDNNNIPTQSVWNEKCSDLGTYIALLYASVQDRINTKPLPF